MFFNCGKINTPPTASFTVNPTSGDTSTVFNVDAGDCSDAEDSVDVLQVRWDWENDGTWDTNYSTTKTATHQYTTEGTYTIKLEVKDTGGLVNSTTKQVIISNSSINPNVQNVLSIIEANNIYNNTDKQRNRSLLKDPLKNLTFSESKEFMNIIRKDNKVEDLINALIDIKSSVVNSNALINSWKSILQSGKLDYFIEILTYTDYNSDSGTYCAGNSVHIYDYNAVGIGCIIHESNHSFNFTHGVGDISGLNEGTSITVIHYYDDGWKNLAETIFGTVLYYRDIGISGYPKDIPISDPNLYDAKGKEFMKFLMNEDESKINWFDSNEVQTIFDLYWKPLNRNVPWEQWVNDAKTATQNGIEWINAHR